MNTTRNWLAGVAFLTSIILPSPATQAASDHSPITTDLLRYVNLLQGTRSSGGFSTGGTLPLVARPFGMTDWTLQTGEGGWGWFFDPQSRSLQGIRATHQPSPWMGDYGYCTVMAQTGRLYWKPSQRASAYQLDETVLQPNYLKVPLRRYDTLLEMTPTERCAVFRFSFPKGETGRVILQMEGDSQITVDADKGLVSGFTRTKSDAPANFACYYVARFSQHPTRALVALEDHVQENAASAQGTRAGAAIEFASNAPVEMQIGTSFISADQALKNLQNEAGTQSFDAIRAGGSAVWNEALHRITVEGASQRQLQTFYSCLYRAHLFPRIFHEINGEGKTVHYSAYDGKVHDGVSYTDSGFWDTFRTVYPLFSLIQPQRYGEMIEGFLQGYREGGWMAQWPSPGYRVSMPGTHGDAILADAVVKGIGGFDRQEAYAAITKHANQPSSQRGAGRSGLENYLKLGYVPADKEGGSVAETLDYAYDDFCIAQVAQALGLPKDAALYRQRALNYRNLYDPTVGFMRGKNADGSWVAPFNQYEWGGPYVEGGPWQGTWAVQHDPAGLIALMGGPEAFGRKLDQMLQGSSRYDVGSYGQTIHEMTEMAVTPFHQYDHGNQPGHHVLYLFAAAGQPWKTQYWVRRVMNELYSPEGFAGDEDNGEMASWYVLNALGIYPLCPGRPEYVLGSPLFRSARIHVPGRPDFIIEAANNAPQNVYVQKVLVNGKPYAPLWIKHETLASGGRLQFQMGAQPLRRNYGQDVRNLPSSLTPYGAPVAQSQH